MSRVEAPNCVTIFGGGISGLTAAHELVERGFRVQVWEPECDARFPEKGCDVGGMARTQWSRVHWPLARDVTQAYPLVKALPWELRRVGNYPDVWKVFPDDAGGLDPKWLMEQILARIPSDDYEARVTVEMRYIGTRGVTTLRAVEGKDEVEDQGTPLEKQGLERRSLSEVRAVLKEHFRAEDGEDDWTLRIHRLPAASVQVHIRPVLEDPWVAEVMSAHGEDLRLVFHYARPWGEEAEPIVTLPQKGYLRQISAGQADTMAGATTAGIDEAAALFNALWIEVGGLTRYGDPGLGAAMRELARDIHVNPSIQHVYLEVTSRKRGGIGKWDWNVIGALRNLMQWAVASVVVLQSPPEPSNVPTVAVPALRLLDTQGNLHLAFRFPNGRIVSMTAVLLMDYPYDEQENVKAPTDSSTPPATYYDVVLSVRVREHWLPGEHGYRFFPAFYHHVFDTMHRTPVLDRIPKSHLGQSQEHALRVAADEYKYEESFRVVFDNLKSQKYSAYAFADGQPPELFDRNRVQSLEKRLEMLHSLTRPVGQGGMGLTTQDLTRMGLHALKYVTSSKARRAEYEDVTWMEFIQSDTLSPEAQNAIRHFPKSLVAMDAQDGDARTLGSAGLQTIMDQFVVDSGFRDGTLAGPTSEAWFKYWRQYLEAQGVEFIHGRLTGFEVRTSTDGRSTSSFQTQRIWPLVECYEPRFAFEEIEPLGEPALMPGYFVLALPAQEINRIAVQYMNEVGEKFPHRDLARAAQLDLGNPRSCVPDGELRHFAGVQFYFEEDVMWLDGHAYYPDSPWNLTTISQARFWADRHDWEHGYRGIMSVIIGCWDAPGTGNKKTAWECSREELIAEVWHQIEEGLEDTSKKFGGRLPRPLYWHLDDFMTKGDEAWINASPFQIERPGNFKHRPGDLGEDGYSVEHGIGLCGTYMKTHTRITTMEAANESGRHVTNAILRDVNSPYRRTLCEIFPIEDREPDDLSFLKEVDARLYEEGLPHIFDIVGADDLVKQLVINDNASRADLADVIRRYHDLVRNWCTRYYPHCIPW